MITRLLYLFAATLITLSCFANNNLYQNPVVGKNLPDPTIIKVGDTFYLYATEEARKTPIYKSTNLTDWDFVGTAFTPETRPTFEPKGGLWAPDINFINGKYVLYYSMSVWGGEETCGIGVAVADKPEGPFTDKGKLFRSNEIGVTNSIDQFYIEEGGKKYLFWGSFRGIYAIELSDDGLSIKPDAKKQKIAGTAFEGVYIHKKENYYYLFASIGSCCEGVNSTYQLVVGRSSSLFGTYVDKSGKKMLDNGFDIVISKNDRFVGNGHCSEIVQDDAGNDWIFYHGVDLENPKGRILLLDQVKWDKDGWPYVDGGTPSLSAEKPTFYKENEFFTNPVIPGDVADPTVIRIGNTYYAAGTSSEWAPYYPMFKSTDLVNWTQTGHIFNKLPKWTKSSFWAPELFYHNGKVFAYYTARRKSDNVSYIGVASTNDPEKEFTDHGLLVEYGTEAIDAFVFEDQGQLYISWKAYGLDNRPIEIIGSKLSSDGLRLEGEPFTMLKDTEDIGMEGQYHFKKGDYYYIIYSPHGCCGPNSDYDVYVARSKNLKGPYEKYEKNPILRGGGDFMSSGHGTVVDTPDGRMFYMCHAYFPGARFFNGRQPILQEMVMTDDNWIKVTTGNLAQVKQAMPFPNTIQKPVPDFEDNFEGKQLKHDWTWNYPYSEAKTQLKNGNLSLKGDVKKETKNGTALCIRSNTPHYSFETQVVNTNSSLKGLTFYGDDDNFIALGSEGNQLVLKTVQRGKETILNKITLPSTQIYLKVEVTEGCDCTFFWSKDGTIWNEIKSSEVIDSKQLVRWDRVSRPGLIHNGKQPAEFSYFKMTNLR